MNKTILFLLLSLNTCVLLAQDNYDVRKIRWGMTMQEVISSEYPLTPKIKDNRLEFSNVDIGNSFHATLFYDFSNGRVNELIYIVYNSEYNRTTCEKITPFIQKVRYAKYIFKELKIKGYKFSLIVSGWYFPKDIGLLTNIKGNNNDNWEAKFNEKMLLKIDKIAKEKGKDLIDISLKNERCYVHFSFNEYQNSKTRIPDEYKNLFPCNGDNYNSPFRITFKPSYETEKKLNKNRF